MNELIQIPIFLYWATTTRGNYIMLDSLRKQKKPRKNKIYTPKTIDTRNHAFNVGIAIDYSPLMALWLGHIAYWMEQNLSLDRHIHDGLCWMYDTLEAIGEKFPYLTRRQIETMINNSVDEGLIVKGNYNHTGYDRTCWYALAPKAYFYFQHLLTEKYLKRLFLSISHNCEMDFTDFGNGFPRNVTPIPHTDPHTDPNTCVGVSDAPATHTNIKELKKEKAEKNALECDEVQDLFKAKFQGRAISLHEIFEDCKEHYEQKSLWATKDKFLKWLKREKAENYPQIDTHSGKKSNVVKLFTDEEDALLGEYRHYLKTWSTTKTIEEWFPNEEKRNKVLEAVAKEKELMKNADRRRMQANSK